MSHSLRRFASLFFAAALAFAQLAISAYACPMGAASSAPVSTVEESVPACPEVANANLCAGHCEYGAASVDTLSTPLPAVDLAPTAWRVPASPVAELPAPSRDWRLSRTMYPPTPILFGTLRI